MTQQPFTLLALAVDLVMVSTKMVSFAMSQTCPVGGSNVDFISFSQPVSPNQLRWCRHGLKQPNNNPVQGPMNPCDPGCEDLNGTAILVPALTLLGAIH